MYGAPEATFALLFFLTQYIELKKNNNANGAYITYWGYLHISLFTASIP